MTEAAQMLQSEPGRPRMLLYTWQTRHLKNAAFRAECQENPLDGENVCGLHIPENLRIMRASDNIRKGNKLEGD
jgi:hypothetical protein